MFYQEHTERYFHRDKYCIVASIVVNEQYEFLGFIQRVYMYDLFALLAGRLCPPPPNTPHVVFSHAYDLLNYHNHKGTADGESWGFPRNFLLKRSVRDVL